MSDNHGKLLYLLTGTLLLCGLAGCRHEQNTADSAGLVPQGKLGTRIGSVAKVIAPEPVAVEGYGLVGGLPGTGSGDCPAGVREYLRRYIQMQLPAGGYDVDKLIDSKNTAVVRLEGTIPVAALKNESFDVRVSLPAGSEATSLHGGWLYKAELMLAGRGIAASRALATVEGPVFIDMIDASKPDLRNAYILGGGRVAGDYQGIMSLRKADYLLSSQIRNRLNERYGVGTAEALSPNTIGFHIPVEYRPRRMWFMSMIGATYLEQTPELIDARVNTMVHQLAASDRKEECEVTLEATGRVSVNKLAGLLNASDEEVRLRAARCMLNLGDDRGFETLREIALDSKSQRRLEALNGLMLSPSRDDAAPLAQGLLRDRDTGVAIGAYERLRDMNDPSILRERVGRSFFIEHVVQTDRQAIYVTRSGAPRIVLFGPPVQCRKDVFVQSSDGTVVVNSKPGQEYVSLIRRPLARPGRIEPVYTGFDLAEIIRTLGAEPAKAKDGGLPGLNVSYSDVIVLVQQLATKGMVTAEFWAGPLPKQGLIIKK